jgi:hypothetical protein
MTIFPYMKHCFKVVALPQNYTCTSLIATGTTSINIGEKLATFSSVVMLYDKDQNKLYKIIIPMHWMQMVCDHYYKLRHHKYTATAMQYRRIKPAVNKVMLKEATKHARRKSIENARRRAEAKKSLGQ